MATIQQQIIEKFLERLTESKKIDTERIEQLRTLLSGTTKAKTEDFVKLFSLPAGGDLK